MYGTSVFLGFAVLLVTANARPDGYGVKGGGFRRPAANAAASARATAHADAGSLGIAKSSATANADSSGGGTSSAYATAVASLDGGNIGKVIASEKATGNANGPGDSDDLSQSSDHGGDTEYKCINHKDGIAGSSHRHHNAEHVTLDTDKENSERTTDSQHSVGSEGGYGGNVKKPGTIGGSHAVGPCAPGDSKCLANRPSVSNPYPTYEKNPDLSAGSSSPAGIDGSYGGNGQKPGGIGGSHAAGPCPPGDSKCYAHKPSVSSSYPIYEVNPNQSADSQHSIEIDAGYGGKSPRPGTIGGSHAASPCAPGDSKCYANKPSVSNPYPTYEKNPDLSAGSSSRPGIDGGYGGNSPRPGTIGGNHAASPCAPGDSKCYANKPSVSNPYPTYEKIPDLSAGSSSRPGIDGGYGGNSPRPGTIGGNHAASPCAPGDSKCYANKPSVSNPYPTYEQNSDTWESGSKYPASPDGSYGDRPTTGDHPSSGSHTGHSASSGNKPETSNPFLNGEIDLSGIKNPSNSGGLPGGKPNPLNPFLNPHNQVRPPTGSSHPSTPGGNNGVSVGVAPQYPQGGSSGTSEFPQDKPKPSNPFLSHGHGDESTGTKYPGLSGSDHGNNYPHAEAPSNVFPGKDCQGSASCSTNKPLGVPPEYPFLTNHGSNGSGSKHESTQSPDKQPGDSNPFFVDGQLTKPHSNKPESHGTSDFNPEHVPSISNPRPGYNNEPSNERKPVIVEGCGSGISSAGCNNHKGPSDKDVQSWLTEGHEIDATTSNKDYGVKGHWAGVKGGSHHQGHPIRFQGDSGLGESGHFGSEQKGSVESIANASASAHSSAHASSSSFSGAGQSNASAKSEAYSSSGSSGSSNSWASSSASASAFASSGSSSSNSHHDWTAPEIPQVTAQ